MTKQTASVNIALYNSDTPFRAWGSAASTCLQACGLVKTSDTGQVDWTTATKPTTTGTKGGYEIYRFNDALQSTKPIYLRIDYGTGGGTSGTNPATWLTVGTGTNGAGTITGVLLGPLQSGSSSASQAAATAMAMHFTHSTANGYLLMNFGLDWIGTGASNAPAGTFILERTKDSAGNCTADGVGVTYLVYAATPSWFDVSYNFASGTAYPTARLPHCGAQSTAVSLSSGSALSLFKHYIGAGAPYYAVGRLSHFLGDIAAGTTFSATPVGATSHTYMCPSNPTALKGGDTSGSANIVLDFMWED